MKFFKWIFGLSNSPYRKDSPSRYPKLDRDAIKRSLTIMEEAKKRGNENLPRENSIEPDEIERRIIHFMETESENAKTSFLFEVDTFRQRLATLHIDSCLEAFDVEVKDTISQMREKIKSGINRLHLSINHLRLAKSHLDSFCKENQINRPCQSGGSSLSAIALLSIFALFELVVNAVFLAMGSEAGLIGGFVTAFMISFITTALSYACGRGLLPRAMHGKWKPLWAIFALISFILIISSNLFVAHFREISELSLATDETVKTDTMSLCLQGVFANPFLFREVETLIMFAGNICLAGFMVWKFFTLKDPIPGYSRVSVTYAEATEDYRLKSDYLSSIIGNEKQQAQGSIISLKDDYITRLQSQEQILSHYQGEMTKFFSHLKDLELHCNDLLLSYRQENERHRKETSPSYWKSHRWSHQSVEVPVIEARYNNNEVREVIDQIKSFEAKASKEVIDVHDALLKEYKSITDAQS